MDMMQKLDIYNNIQGDLLEKENNYIQEKLHTFLIKVISETGIMLDMFDHTEYQVLCGTTIRSYRHPIPPPPAWKLLNITQVTMQDTYLDEYKALLSELNQVKLESQKLFKYLRKLLNFCEVTEDFYVALPESLHSYLPERDTESHSFSNETLAIIAEMKLGEGDFIEQRIITNLLCE